MVLVVGVGGWLVVDGRDCWSIMGLAVGVRWPMMVLEVGIGGWLLRPWGSGPYVDMVGSGSTAGLPGIG